MYSGKTGVGVWRGALLMSKNYYNSATIVDYFLSGREKERMF